MNPGWSAEIPKVVSNLLVAMVTIVAGWLVGQKLTYGWNIRQKQRELFLAAASQFHVAYGEFFAVWKIWNRLEPQEKDFDGKRWDLLQRAAKAEAITESIVLKIATEVRMTVTDTENLGRFRQGFQCLRQSIRDSKKLEWKSSEHEQYVAFKRLSCRVAILLQRQHEGVPPTAQEAAENHRTATSNQWERNWWDMSGG